MYGFSGRMRGFRKKYGMTQADLGAAIGLTDRTIRNIEAERYTPWPSTILKFAELEERYRRAEEAEDELTGVS